MKTIIVLDYSSGLGHLFNCPPHLESVEIPHEDVESWLEEQGFRIKDIYWMSGGAQEIIDHRK